MKEITIKIPNGWFFIPAVIFVLIVFVLAIWPWYNDYTRIRAAKTQAEVSKILNADCRGINLP